MDILIVDDEVVMRSLVALAIQRDGYSVTVAASAAQALDYLATTTPNLIILDVMMPQLDGITFCRQLRSDPATAKIPIIIFSAAGDERSKRKALAAGATHFCHKLSMYDDLFELIHENLHPAQQQRYPQPIKKSQAAAVQAGQSKLH